MIFLVDFAVFYFAGLVVYAERLNVKLPQNFFNFTGPDNFHHPRYSSPPPFALLSSFPLSFPVLCLHFREWHVAVRYFIAKYSAYMVLVSVFLCGLGEADVISLGYLGFSLLVLFMGNRYLTPSPYLPPLPSFFSSPTSPPSLFSFDFI